MDGKFENHQPEHTPDDSHFVLGISDYDGSFPVFYSLDSSCKIFLLGKYYYVMAFNPEKIILKLADEQ